MPQPVFHLYLAEQVYHLLPIVDSPAARNAFLHGAIAPDVGFFPGAPKRLSTITHQWRTADMCRSMLRLATNDVEVAFAWGWVTHLVADMLLHPIINEWCAQQLPPGSSAADQLRLHVQLEIGIDVMHVATVQRAGIPTFHSTFDEATIGFLRNAYEHTYNLRVSPRVLLKAHRSLESLTRQLIDLELMLAGAADPRLASFPSRVVINVLRTVTAVSSGPRSIVTAFLFPVYPPLQLGLQFRDQVDRFYSWFERCVATDLRCLPNVDLNTGLEISEETSFAVA